MGSIAQFREFIKSFPLDRRRDFVVVAVIVLVSGGSFALGRLSALENSEGILIEQRATVHKALGGEGNNDSVQADTLQVPDKAGSVVASRAGTKYHFPWCAGAKSIKEENKIWFDSIEAARAAGYLPAGNCKGLK